MYKRQVTDVLISHVVAALGLGRFLEKEPTVLVGSNGAALVRLADGLGKPGRVKSLVD